MRVHFLIGIAMLLVLSVTSTAAQDTSMPPASEIVARMVAHDAQRLAALEGYAGMRRYILVNEHMHKRAEMLVRVQGDLDGTKHFEIVSEEGWKAAHKHVLHKCSNRSQKLRAPKRGQNRG